MAKINLNKLTEEIESRKKEKNTVLAGGEQYSGVSPRDAFLYGLQQSLAHGNPTRAVANMRTLNERAEIINSGMKSGNITNEMVTRVKELKEIAPVVQQPIRQQSVNQEIYQSPQAIDISPERDELLYRDIEARRKGTLVESLELFEKTKSGSAQMNQTIPSGMLNEGYLIENVKKVVNNYLNENLAPVFEEAIKNTIIEMYAVERIKEVLQENKEMIKSVVIETIKEIQARNKATKAQN